MPVEVYTVNALSLGTELGSNPSTAHHMGGYVIGKTDENKLLKFCYALWKVVVERFYHGLLNRGYLILGMEFESPTFHHLNLGRVV